MHVLVEVQRLANLNKEVDDIRYRRLESRARFAAWPDQGVKVDRGGHHHVTCCPGMMLYFSFDDRFALDDMGHYDAMAIVNGLRSEEHTSELQSLMRISYAVFCL